LKYDSDQNGKIDNVNDRVFLYMSQGRGGDNYYALDITDKNNPKFMWSLGYSPSSLGSSNAFGVVNKSWSTPVIARVDATNAGKTQNSQKLVLIFGGGYDDYNENNQGYQAADTYGNGIYMIDAVTGSLLWSQTKAGSGAFSKMTHAIPSIVSVLDTDGDGYSDRMYVGDMAGQLWRFDIYNGAANSSSAPLVTGGVIASVGEKGQATPTLGDIVNNRKFYSAPDIAKVIVSGAANYYNIAIGTGDRAHPKSNTTTLDRFYSIRDYKLAAQTQSYYDSLTPVKDSDLSVTDGSAAISNTYGWKVVMNAKEKALAQSITVNGAIMFTTYEPNPPTDVCAPSTGTGRAYTLKFNGTKYFSSISETFNTSGIPASINFFQAANIIKTLENETAASSSSSTSTSSSTSSSSSSSSSAPSTYCASGVYILGNCATASTRAKTIWSESGAK
jgi:type IV pilus assembly protein PilY1